MANDTPGTLVNQWTSTKGTKGTTVVVAVVVVLMVGPLVAWVSPEVVFS